MKAVLTTINVFLIGAACYSQNLVPNPSFEAYTQIPCDLGSEIIIKDFVDDWLQPIPTSTDYWNNLSNSACYLNPMNAQIIPRTGDAMIGLITASAFLTFPDEYKEYAEVKLTEPLKKGSFYRAGFYTVNRPKRFEGIDPMESNNLGIAFSDSLIFYPVSTGAPDHLLLQTQINENEVIGSEGGWKIVEGCFVAKSSYEYLLIGNFKSINSTKFKRSTVQEDEAYSYYFIDDISVSELPYDVTILENNISFCFQQDSIVLNAYVPGATGYHWDNGTTFPTLVVKEPISKEYTVIIQFNECNYTHTFHVEFIPKITLGPDTLLCDGEKIVLATTQPTPIKRWWDGSMDSIKVISETGLYWVENSNSFCPSIDSILIEIIKCPGSIPNVFTPNGDSYNEFFIAENIGNKQWQLKIFNRWGLIVYENDNYDNSWDGGDLPGGVYYYELYSWQLNKKVKGWVELIK